MKKDEAVAALDRVGMEISDLNSRVWSTALNPGTHGWGSSLLSVAAIPIVNAATIGQLITSVVVKEVPESVFETVSNIGGKKGSSP